MSNRLTEEVMAFLRENAAVLQAISDGRSHGSIVLDIRDGVIAEGSLTLTARRKQGEKMSLLAINGKAH